MARSTPIHRARSRTRPPFNISRRTASSSPFSARSSRKASEPTTPRSFSSCLKPSPLDTASDPPRVFGSGSYSSLPSFRKPTGTARHGLNRSSRFSFPPPLAVGYRTDSPRRRTGSPGGGPPTKNTVMSRSDPFAALLVAEPGRGAVQPCAGEGSPPWEVPVETRPHVQAARVHRALQPRETDLPVDEDGRRCP